jgi:L-amino acid N-acyltransferase YncA
MLGYESTQNEFHTKYPNKLPTFIQPDSNQVNVRAVQPNDAQNMLEMHQRLSQDSIYFRYLGPCKPSTVELKHLCSSEIKNSLTLVATVQDPEEKVVAIAYYQVDPEDPTSAEPAVLVEDGYQGRGIGKQVISKLIQQAIINGIETFVSFVHPANHRIFKMIKHSDFRYQRSYCADLGLSKVQVSLLPE